jgi:hypothetical protein
MIICVKCESKNVYKGQAVAHSGYLAPNRSSLFRWSGAPQITHYICRDCGYLEMQIEKRDDIELICDSWERVTPEE